MIKDKFSKVLFYLLLSVIFVNLFVGDVFAITESSLQNQSSKEIPKSLLPQLVEKLGVANSNYHILNQNGRYISITPSHGIKTVFHKDKVVFNRAQNNIGMSLVSDIKEIYPEKVLDNKIEYRRGNITEWYVNSPYGVEQGFTIKNRPQGIGHEVSLNIEIDVSSNLNVIEGVNGKSVNFLDIKDKHILNYSGLYAFDSTGKELPSNLRLKDNIIEISVDDRNAQYPITIDPFIQAQRVTAADPTSGASDDFAWSVSIDGDRAIVGIPGWDGAAGSGQGAVIIYERNGLGVWVATPTLFSPDPGSNDDFGMAVAISGDWALIGEPDGDDGASNDGTAHFFMRSAGGAWTHQQTVFHTPGTEGESFGISVSISGDRAVVGDPEFELSLASRNSGAIFIYERSGATWNPVASNPILTGDSDSNDEFGTSVSISGDWLIAGAPGDSNNGGFSDFVQWGAVYFFQRVGGTWTETQKVIGDTDNSLLGQAVSIDGTIAIAGSPG